MTAQRAILLLVFVIVLVSTVSEIIFRGFSGKPLLLFLATTAIIIFLWVRPERK
ncbi:hypothetical protein [Bacillus sp. S/N-304-OC-R1]|uniref:hypothetical protein n=1 Tax=Bacillus sp. S/N-304-OC-R1 TaxID=2758034 RepID=UPI001C8D13B3|nr:hypothetical protein [Bacillus sp. S/N-304-OC-R1]MBY0123875.1 hypothetical protein [Bacillus sp. S/N-304-OC-R1]